MTGDSNHKINALSELHEESRYYRRFHHTILSIFITGYIALLILQMSILPDVSKISDDLMRQIVLVWIIVSILFIVIPIFITWLIVHYHIVQGKILENILTLQTALNYPNECKKDKKYEGFKDKCCIKQFFIGFGHKIFITLLWLVVGTNILVFCVIIG